MGLGDEAASRLGAVTRDLEQGSQRLAAQGEALDRAASAARTDIGVLLDDLPRAEATALAMAEALRSAGGEAVDKAARFEAQVASLTERSREADAIVSEAAQRLMTQVAAIEAAGSAAGGRLAETASQSTSTMDALMQRAAESLEEIRGGIDIQATAVAALLAQATAGLGKAGIDSAEALGTRLEAAGGSLDTLTARIAEQERASQRMIADIGMGVATLDERFAQLAADGDSRAATMINALNRMRTDLEALSQESGVQDGAIGGLAERTSALRQSVEQLSLELREQLASAIGEAEAGTGRILATAQSARPEIEWAHQASLEASTRLEAGAGAIEAQHDRLAELLAAVDTGVGGAERRLAELAEAVRTADTEASRLSAETGPALVAALVQVKEAAAHAAERAREAISAVIPDSAGQLSEATRDALEQVVRDSVSDQLREVESVAARALEAARGVSERLTQQMISIGQSAVGAGSPSPGNHRTASPAGQRGFRQARVAADRFDALRLDRRRQDPVRRSR